MGNGDRNNPERSDNPRGRQALADSSDPRPTPDDTGWRRETKRWISRFAFDHLPPNLQPYSVPFHTLAEHLVYTFPDSPDLTVALRNLWGVKNEIVLIGVEREQGHAGAPSPKDSAGALPLAQDAGAPCCRSSS